LTRGEEVAFLGDRDTLEAAGDGAARTSAQVAFSV